MKYEPITPMVAKRQISADNYNAGTIPKYITLSDHISISKHSGAPSPCAFTTSGAPYLSSNTIIVAFNFPIGSEKFDKTQFELVLNKLSLKDIYLLELQESQIIP